MIGRSSENMATVRPSAITTMPAMPIGTGLRERNDFMTPPPRLRVAGTLRKLRSSGAPPRAGRGDRDVDGLRDDPRDAHLARRRAEVEVEPGAVAHQPGQLRRLLRQELDEVLHHGLVVV